MPVAKDQLQFDYLLGDPSIVWYPIKEAARISGMSQRFILEAYELGKISGHSHNAGVARKRKEGSDRRRHTKRIPRWWLAAYMAQTADYDGPMKLHLGLQTLRAFDRDRESLIALHREISRLLTA